MRTILALGLLCMVAAPKSPAGGNSGEVQAVAQIERNGGTCTFVKGGTDRHVTEVDFSEGGEKGDITDFGRLQKRQGVIFPFSGPVAS